MSTLNLLPPRVPIGRAVDSNGKAIDVQATPEFLRSLSSLLDRVGGPNGLSTSDIEMLTASPALPLTAPVDPGFADFLPLESAQAASAADAVARQIADMQAQLDSVQGVPAQMAEVAKTIQALEMAGGEALIQYAQADSAYIKTSSKDKPGGVPGLTALALNLRNVANTLTSFLTNTATAARTWTLPDKNGILATTTEENIVLGSDTSTINTPFLKIWRGGSTGHSGVFSMSNGAIRLDSSTGFTQVFAVGTLSFEVNAGGIYSVGGFGCNGKSAQASYALGAAATDLPTVITLANNMRAALIANGIGS